MNYMKNGKGKLMKVTAFVPVKLNNERLPGKNTKCFSNGRPLISYILNTLLTVRGIDKIYVYCSDDSIKDYLPQGVTFLKRDSYLDLSSTSFNEVLTTFAEKIESDVYILTHATAPFIRKETFEKAIVALKNNNYDSALTVRRLQEFLWKNGKPFNYNPEKIPRTQDLEPIYTETCGMYVYTSDLIKSRRRRVGDRPCLIEVDEIEACDINNPNDFVIANAIAMEMETETGIIN